MRFWRRHQGMRAVLSTLLVLQAGCSSWRVQPVAPAALLAEPPSSRVRLTLTDSSRVELHCPRLVNDTVVGVRRVTTTCMAVGPVPAGDSLSVPLARVDSVAVRKGDVGKSIGLFFGVIAGVLVIFTAVCAATDCLDFSLGGFEVTPGGY